MIAIIDYGMGNLRSVLKKFEKINAEAMVTSDLDVINSADKLVLPGVGHFSMGIQNLKKLGMIEQLQKNVIVEKKPILGICLGMQLFTSYSEEGNCKGLGWFNARTLRFKIANSSKFKVPHMGWNTVEVIHDNELSYNLVNAHTEFYFVHSYHVVCADKEEIWMTSDYEYPFVSAIRKSNIYGVQFHPEKSHDAGLEIFKRFINL